MSKIVLWKLLLIDYDRLSWMHLCVLIMFWVVKSKNVFECLEFWEIFFSYLSYQLMLTIDLQMFQFLKKTLKCAKVISFVFFNSWINCASQIIDSKLLNTSSNKFLCKNVKFILNPPCDLKVGVQSFIIAFSPFLKRLA